MGNFKVYLRYKFRPEHKYEYADNAAEAIEKALKYFPGAAVIMCVRLN